MTISSEKERSRQYSNQTVKRAERALSCCPFKLPLFAAMRNDRVPLLQIVASDGFEKGYTKKPLSERTAETQLMWLISVGLLRREVDGQGITDSFRLTPLGRQLIEKWEADGNFPTPSLLARIYNTLNRWLSFWV